MFLMLKKIDPGEESVVLLSRYESTIMIDIYLNSGDFSPEKK